jgi:hypothetical protein
MSPLQKPFLTGKIAKSAEKIQRRFQDVNIRHGFSYKNIRDFAFS